jgi:PAS domain S-box-containing protein
MSTNIPADKSMEMLRRRAEAAMKGRSGESAELTELSTEEMRRLFHELDVYRVELEMQNEELRRTQDALEEALDKYTDLYEHAPVGYLIVQNHGVIASANVTASKILGESKSDLVGIPVENYIVRDYQDAFFVLRRVSEKKARILSCEIMMQRKDATRFPARMDCIAIPGDDGSTAFRVSFTDISELKGLDLTKK